VLAALIFILYGFVRTPNPADPVPPLQLAFWTTLLFILGALCSVVAGYIGMWVSIRANIRTASAVRTSLNDGLASRSAAARSPAVRRRDEPLGVGGLYALLQAMGHDPQKIPFTIVGYGFGASFVALFAQLGGGIYTKAADVGADLVGKVEAAYRKTIRATRGHRRSRRRQRRRLRRAAAPTSSSRPRRKTSAR
jgi:K(+)-stimulated pyrophosphate-energized sodium pump